MRFKLIPTRAPSARPEAELLRLASRRYANQSSLDRMCELLSIGIDWGQVLKQARRHGVVSSLHYNLSRCRAPIPESVANQLSRIFHESARHNLYLFGELLKILKMLERCKIPAIPFKGPTLAVNAFGDVSWREFSDLDILVREADVKYACAHLAGLGLRCAHHPQWLEPYLVFGHELDLVRDTDGAQVDLQWRFAKKWLSLPLRQQAVWDRAVRTTIGDVTFYQPTPEDGVMILCVHGYRHCWSHLKWISDLCAAIEVARTDIDWPALIGRARQDGGERVLALGLWLAREVGGTELPRSAHALPINTARIEKLGQYVIAHLFDDSTAAGPRGSLGIAAIALFHWRVRERWRGKIPLIKPLLAHASYVARRYATHYARRLLTPISPARSDR
jgi:hypothetical protein